MVSATSKTPQVNKQKSLKMILRIRHRPSRSSIMLCREFIDRGRSIEAAFGWNWIDSGVWRKTYDRSPTRGTQDACGAGRLAEGRPEHSKDIEEGLM